MNVPFLDLTRVHEPLADRFTAGFRDILSRSAFSAGPEIAAFERAFADWVGTKHCVGVSSGLDAEVIGLRALGLRPGDQVVVPAMTFVATLEAVTQAGGEPVLVDVDNDGLMDLAAAEVAARNGARYLLPVHLYGQMVDPRALEAITRELGVTIFEDACQAHGARAGGRRAGTLGRASAFSFYPAKNLGALGDAGALCTDDAELATMARALREHGQSQKYVHAYEGYTARLDNIQACFLAAKLEHVDRWNAERIAAAATYFELLDGLEHVRLPPPRLDGSHVFHLFVVRTSRRGQLADALREAGIGFGIHYPIPMHRLDCYAPRGWGRLRFPVAEAIAAEAISLPIFPGITRRELEAVANTVRRVCA